MGERRWGNFSSCCRLCLSEKLGTLKSIFEDATKSRDVVANIQEFVGLEVKGSDNVSTMICDQCLTKLITWQHFKAACTENQKKLGEWLDAWKANSDVGHVPIQIKDEVMEDGDEHAPKQIVLDDDDNSEVRVKPELVEARCDPEPMDEEDMYDYPPQLSPHTSFVGADVTATVDETADVNEFLNMDSNDSNTSSSTDGKGRVCGVCNRVFTTVENRIRHENALHHHRKNVTKQLKLKETSGNGTSARLQGTDTEIQKIKFAAGLHLQQRSLSSAQSVENLFLTKVELSYLEKCKTIITMTETLQCACHDEIFEDVKELYAHLRKQRTWLAMYTCYNCLITYEDRSTYMRHTANCTKDFLQNLKQLTDTHVNPEIKMRLYQNYKCIKCKCIFGFHNDFCSHFDGEHMEHMELKQDAPPFVCMCSQSFEELEDYKQHLNITCFLRYFCDVCYDTFETIDDFKLHCESKHDSDEGVNSENVDYSHKNVQSNSPELHEDVDEGPITRRRTVNMPFTNNTFEDPDYMPDRRKSLQALYNIKSSKPTGCPDCGRTYSSYHNMLRHYKMAHDVSGKILQCSYCLDKFRLLTELKEHENLQHSGFDVNKPGNQLKYACPECGMLFKSVDNWNDHLDTHPKKVCTECDKEFISQNDLDQHRSVHLNIKVYRDSETKNYKSEMVGSSLVCEVCDEIFESNGGLQEHKLTHSLKDLSKKYSCIPCNKHYVSYGGIWDHNKKHHGGKQVTNEFPRDCEICNKSLLSRGAWVNHQRMHARMAELNNANDEDGRSAKMKIIKTDKYSDDSESYYTCNRCFKVFSSKYNLRNHMKCHGINLNANRSSLKTGKVIKTFWCNICHQACPGYAELQQHKREHLAEKTKSANKEEEEEEEVEEKKPPVTFDCDLCTATFSTSFALKRHYEKHPDLIPKQFSVYCKYCKIPFPDVQQLNTHMENEHDQVINTMNKNKSKSPTKKFVCKLCKKAFNNAGALSSHQGWHKRGKFYKNGKVYGKVFKNTEKVIVPKFRCGTCSMVFVNDTALQIHILETHRNINATVLNLNCSSCKIGFESKAAYDIHMQFHQQLEGRRSSKPHPCNFCSAGFSRSDTLNAHIKQHHKEHYNELFKCNQCDRTFDKQNALTIHSKTHDRQRMGDDKPKPIHNKNIYFCSICDLGFVIAKDLRNHVVSAHPF